MNSLKFLPFGALIFVLAACHSESVEIPTSCEYNAVVEDHSDLDGCGFLLRLNNGEYLEPIWPFFCQTPPQPIKNPMEDFEMVDGKRVLIEFEYLESFATACMGGSLVMINSVKEVRCANAE